MNSRLDLHKRNFCATLQDDGSYLLDRGEILWYNEFGELHRDDGPATVYPDGKIDWYWEDDYHTFNTWLMIATISDEQKMMLRLQYG